MDIGTKHAGSPAAHESFSTQARCATAGLRGAVLMLLAAVGTAVPLLLGLGWLATRAMPAGAEIGPAAYASVKEGMHREEVESAIGLPPGDYRDREHKPGGRSYTEWSEEAGNEEFVAGATAGRVQWEGNAYSITTGFDESGVVAWKTLWKHVPPTPRDPLGRLRAWLDQ